MLSPTWSMIFERRRADARDRIRSVIASCLKGQAALLYV